MTTAARQTSTTAVAYQSSATQRVSTTTVAYRMSATRQTSTAHAMGPVQTLAQERTLDQWSASRWPSSRTAGCGVDNHGEPCCRHPSSVTAAAAKTQQHKTVISRSVHPPPPPHPLTGPSQWESRVRGLRQWRRRRGCRASCGPLGVEGGQAGRRDGGEAAARAR